MNLSIRQTNRVILKITRFLLKYRISILATAECNYLEFVKLVWMLNNYNAITVPSAPPEDVRCASLSVQSLQVSWQPPPTIHCNGLVEGYKLTYEPVLDDNWKGKCNRTTPEFLSRTITPTRNFSRTPLIRLKTFLYLFKHTLTIYAD